MKARSLKELRQSGADIRDFLDKKERPVKQPDTSGEQVKVLQAISKALDEIDRKSTAEVKALVVTLQALVGRMAEIQERPKAWEFDISRGQDKLITQIKATAKEN